MDDLRNIALALGGLIAFARGWQVFVRLISPRDS